MEKITYPPLIEHLKEQSDYYNQLYRNYQMKYGAIEMGLISFWIVKIIEPVVTKVNEKYPEKLPSVFGTLYAELLQILGSKMATIYENEYLRAWGLFSIAPNLVAIYPGRMIKAINSALESIRSYQPDKVLKWIEIMEVVIPLCQTIEEFLAAGRISGWICGMAHLRTRAKDEYLKLSKEVKDVIASLFGLEGRMEEVFLAEWADLKLMEFMGEVGGFTGFNGPFSNAPLVASVHEYILITDRSKTFAYFGDAFGKVILSEVPVAPEKVLGESNKKELDNFLRSHRNQVPFDDITSCALKDRTMVITRSSSHYLYIYGLPV